MQKTAQKRSIFNKLREFVDIPGAQVEKFFKPELARVMSDLKIADDNIRTLLTSQKIGDADIDVPAGKPVKDLLKSARTNFNRRAYMAGVADLGQFHKRLYDVSRLIDNLQLSVDKIHHNFLFQNLSPEQEENIRNLREHMSNLTASQESQYFIKEAGLMDFFYNIGTKPGRALAIWEKRYPKVAKELREQGSRLIDQAEAILASVISNLKIMATARATRNVDNYMSAASKISMAYKKFDSGDKGFRAYYNNIVKPSLEQQDRIENVTKQPTPSVKVPDAKEMGKQEINAPLEDESQTSPTISQNKPQLSLFGPQNTAYQPLAQVPSTALPAPPPVPAFEEGAGMSGPPTNPQSPPAMSVSPPTPSPIRMKPEEMRQFEAQHGFGGALEAHEQFLQSLEALSESDPRIMAAHISKYAKSIKQSNPEKAIELFTIAKRLKG